MSSFLDTWKSDGFVAALRGDEQPPSQQASAQPPVVAVVSTNFPRVPQSVIPTNGLQDSTKQAFVEEVAMQVPDLKKLLDGAALIVEDVPDLQKRLSITAKQLKASGQFNAQMALAGLRQSVATISESLKAEVAEEEVQNITRPTEQMQQLEAQRQELLQQAEVLAEQAGTLRLRVTTAQENLGKSRLKCDAGVVFMQTWQSQMEQLLSSLK